MNAATAAAALKRALDQDPRNGPLWLLYAEQLERAGRGAEATAALRIAIETPEVRREAGSALVRRLRLEGSLPEALIRAESLLAEKDDPELRLELAAILEARGDAAGAAEARGGAPAEATRAAGEPPGREAAPAPVSGESSDPAEWAKLFDWGHLRVTLADVVGMPEVKRQVDLRILAPFKKPEVYAAYGRDAGGGLLLYGPPGCGKTYLARAVAGEIGARFVAVSIHDIVDKFWGESEKLVHALFEDARRNRPAVLFFDEFDALGARRGGASESQFWKVLVDELLHEMDGVGAANREILVLAATNLPWNVDAAFRRPGRFDRVLFVPPPDEDGRRLLFEKHARKLPGGAALDLGKLARATALYTGADIKSLCERAAEEPLERSLASGAVATVTMKDFERALSGNSSSALEWFSQARNFARYANDGGHYDALIAYLKSVKKW